MIFSYNQLNCMVPWRSRPYLSIYHEPSSNYEKGNKDWWQGDSKSQQWVVLVTHVRGEECAGDAGESKGWESAE